MIETKEIPLSKSKIQLLSIGSVAFVFIGVLFAIRPELFISRLFKNADVIRVAGIASIIFFSLCLIFLLRKLFDHKAGLVIDEYGITDNTNATSVGLIEWEDIIGIKKIQIASAKILLILTDKPDKYIQRAKNVISKQAMKTNYRLYGSPISIISNSLKISFDELEKIVTAEFYKREK